ncbi:unnamed protein product [Rhizoctonia solani]|uniref:Uncharacterized protein n=1 Tax=Rhizoctonia solani TaxID=456999 RepID=A0A8H2XJU7_9AGAM|nr:unnamed protein product [Rhizoctonia solani]
MNREIKRPRKLVVLFNADKVDDSWLMERIIQSDQSDRPQLVHRQPVQQSEIYRQKSVENPSGIHHFFIRMKLNQRSTRIKPSPSTASLALERPRSPIDEAVWEAYNFITCSYKPGDDVILLVNTWTDSLSGGEYQLKAAQVLARHLHYGTRPSDPSEFPYESGDNVTGKLIPIHCVGIISPGTTGSISGWSDQLKSR